MNYEHKLQCGITLSQIKSRSRLWCAELLLACEISWNMITDQSVTRTGQVSILQAAKGIVINRQSASKFRGHI